MVLGKSLTLSQGTNSVSLQNQGEINGNVNIGLSLSDITNLFETLFSAKLPSLIADAKSESYKAIADFALTFYEKLNSTVDEAVSERIDERMERKFASSEVQSLITEIVNQVGTKSEVSLNELLANLLVKKLTEDNNSYIINQSIAYLKYLNKEQILFLRFIRDIRYISGLTVTYSGGVFDSDAFSVYKEIDSKISCDEQKIDLKEKAQDFYKAYINNISEVFLNNISNPINVDLLTLNNMLFSDKHYTLTTLDLLGKGLGLTDYKLESLKIDFPKFVAVIEFLEGNIGELDELFKPLTPFGQCVADNCKIGVNSN